MAPVSSHTATAWPRASTRIRSNFLALQFSKAARNVVLTLLPRTRASLWTAASYLVGRVTRVECGGCNEQRDFYASLEEALPPTFDVVSSQRIVSRRSLDDIDALEDQDGRSVPPGAFCRMLGRRRAVLSPLTHGDQLPDRDLRELLMVTRAAHAEAAALVTSGRPCLACGQSPDKCSQDGCLKPFRYASGGLSNYASLAVLGNPMLSRSDSTAALGAIERSAAARTSRKSRCESGEAATNWTAARPRGAGAPALADQGVFAGVCSHECVTAALHMPKPEQLSYHVAVMLLAVIAGTTRFLSDLFCMLYNHVRAQAEANPAWLTSPSRVLYGLPWLAVEVTPAAVGQAPQLAFTLGVDPSAAGAEGTARAAYFEAALTAAAAVAAWHAATQSPLPSVMATGAGAAAAAAAAFRAESQAAAAAGAEAKAELDAAQVVLSELQEQYKAAAAKVPDARPPAIGPTLRTGGVATTGAAADEATGACTTGTAPGATAPGAAGGPAVAGGTGAGTTATAAVLARLQAVGVQAEVPGTDLAGAFQAAGLDFPPAPAAHGGPAGTGAAAAADDRAARSAVRQLKLRVAEAEHACAAAAARVAEFTAASARCDSDAAMLDGGTFTDSRALQFALLRAQLLCDSGAEPVRLVVVGGVPAVHSYAHACSKQHGWAAVETLGSGSEYAEHVNARLFSPAVAQLHHTSAGNFSLLLASRITAYNARLNLAAPHRLLRMLIRAIRRAGQQRDKVAARRAEFDNVPGNAAITDSQLLEAATRARAGGDDAEAPADVRDAKAHASKLKALTDRQELLAAHALLKAAIADCGSGSPSEPADAVQPAAAALGATAGRAAAHRAPRALGGAAAGPVTALVPVLELSAGSKAVLRAVGCPPLASVADAAAALADVEQRIAKLKPVDAGITADSLIQGIVRELSAMAASVAAAAQSLEAERAIGAGSEMKAVGLRSKLSKCRKRMEDRLSYLKRLQPLSAEPQVVNYAFPDAAAISGPDDLPRSLGSVHFRSGDTAKDNLTTALLEKARYEEEVAAVEAAIGAAASNARAACSMATRRLNLLTAADPNLAAGGSPFRPEPVLGPDGALLEFGKRSFSLAPHTAVDDCSDLGRLYAAGLAHRADTARRQIGEVSFQLQRLNDGLEALKAASGGSLATVDLHVDTLGRAAALRANTGTSLLHGVLAPAAWAQIALVGHAAAGALLPVEPADDEDAAAEDDAASFGGVGRDDDAADAWSLASSERDAADPDAGSDSTSDCDSQDEDTGHPVG